MFEVKILLINVLLPSAMMLLAIGLARFLDKSPQTVTTDAAATAGESRSLAGRIVSTVVVAAAVLAIWSAFALRNALAVWHEDAWMRLPLGMALVGLTSAVTIWVTSPWVVAVLRLLGVSAAAWLIFPQGEAWDFLLPTRNYWMAAVAGSTWTAWMLIDRRSPREAGVQGLAWIVLFAAAAFLTAQSFLKVTEPLLAVSAVIGCLALVSLRGTSQPLVAVAAGPALFSLSAAIASAQFNSFLGLPDVLSWLAMFTPTIAAGVSWPLKTKVAVPGQSLKKSYIIACVISCSLLAGLIVAWTAQLAGGGGGEEW